MDDTALLPCPFCGEDAYDDMPTWRVFGARTGHEYAIACSSCEAVAPGDDDSTLAIAAWNRRVAPTTTRQEGIALGLAEAARVLLDMPPNKDGLHALPDHMRAALEQIAGGENG